MLKDFKEFVMRGNVADMAVGVIIGAAFGRIVTSLVNDVLMPPIGQMTGGADFTDFFISLSPGSYATLAEAQAAGAATINYGVFLSAVVNFLIVAAAIFLTVEQLKRLKVRSAKAAAAAPSTKDCPFCLSAIPLKAVKCAHCTSDQPAA